MAEWGWEEGGNGGGGVLADICEVSPNITRKTAQTEYYPTSTIKYPLKAMRLRFNECPGMSG